MKKLGVCLLAVIALASVMLTGVFSARAAGHTPFLHAGRGEFELGEGGRASFEFVPGVTGSYDVYVFPGSGAARSVTLKAGEQILARGAGMGHVFTAGLAAGAEYELEAEGTGSVVVGI